MPHAIRRRQLAASAFVALVFTFAITLVARASVAAPAEDAWWRGAWKGEIASSVTGQPGLPVHIVVKPAAGAPVVEVTSVRAGAIAKPAMNVLANDATLSFTLDAGGRRARFEGFPAAAGKEISGSFHFLDDAGNLVPPAQRWTMQRVDLVSEVATARTYGGRLEVGGQALDIQLAIGEGPNGWCGAIEVSLQGLRNFPASVARATDGFVVGVPLQPSVTMLLTPSDDGKMLAGTFAQGSFNAPIVFTEMPGARLAGSRRPQDPVAPFPYADREVRIAHAAGHALAGTLSMPADLRLGRDGKVPAVVLVSGSGPQDRDESIFGHRPFAVIADALARAGFAVLRYDDRGVGGSTGVFARAATADFASDADLAVEWLRAQPGIDLARVGVIGHSEGAVIAPLVAVWQASDPNPVAFTVLLAPPALPGGEILTRQSKALYDAAGLPEAASAPILAAHAKVMAAVGRRAPANELQPLVEELVRLQLTAGGQPLPPAETLQATFAGALAQVVEPWMSEWIRYDPRSVLSALRAPTLAMCGTKDLQVDAASNLAVLDGLAKSGVPVLTRRYEGLNHLFQPAQAGVPDEYATIDITFDPSALAEMTAWLVEAAGRAPAAAASEPPSAELLAQLPRRLYRFVPPAPPAETKPSAEATP